MGYVQSGMMTTEVMRLIRIGYWKGPGALNWPDAKDFVDSRWNPNERDDVASYLRHGMVAAAFMGFSKCRFCGKDNGSLELTDGVYIWPEGLAHYVIDHDVRLPLRFVEHVYAMRDRIDAASVDAEWWCRLRSPA